MARRRPLLVHQHHALRLRAGGDRSRASHPHQSHRGGYRRARSTEGAGGIAARGGGGPRTGGAAGVLSPDGKRAAFIKEWNLWVRDVATKQERQLTTDGVKNFGYATDNAGWVKSARAMLKWSPDSRKIATQQQDERQVADMYLLETRVGQPILHTWKYSFSGDSILPMIHRVIIDVDAGRVIRLQMPPDFHRATYSDNISMNDYNWSPDGSQSGSGFRDPRPPDGDAQAGRRRNRSRPDCVVGERQYPLRVANGLAGALGHE